MPEPQTDYSGSTFTLCMAPPTACPPPRIPPPSIRRPLSTTGNMAAYLTGEVKRLAIGTPVWVEHRRDASRWVKTIALVQEHNIGNGTDLWSPASSSTFFHFCYQADNEPAVYETITGSFGVYKIECLPLRACIPSSESLRIPSEMAPLPAPAVDMTYAIQLAERLMKQLKGQPANETVPDEEEI